jgi:hypothetical protein
MSEFIVQMPLNLLWYPTKEKTIEANEPQEYDWDLVPDGQRPTEEEAIRNVSGGSNVIRMGSKLRLNSQEYKVCRLELESYRKCPRHFNQAERERWIAKEIGLGVQTVKDILRDADRKTFQDMVLREAQKDHRELVREVLAEMFPYYERNAA